MTTKHSKLRSVIHGHIHTLVVVRYIVAPVALGVTDRNKAAIHTGTIGPSDQDGRSVLPKDAIPETDGEPTSWDYSLFYTSPFRR